MNVLEVVVLEVVVLEEGNACPRSIAKDGVPVFVFLSDVDVCVFYSRIRTW